VRIADENLGPTVDGGLGSASKPVGHHDSNLFPFVLMAVNTAEDETVFTSGECAECPARLRGVGRDSAPVSFCTAMAGR
jgi:hypothetical protein